jgi:hypothetical protein
LTRVEPLPFRLAVRLVAIIPAGRVESVPAAALLADVVAAAVVEAAVVAPLITALVVGAAGAEVLVLSPQAAITRAKTKVKSTKPAALKFVNVCLLLILST